MSDDDYTAVEGLVNLLQALHNGADIGTGVKKLILFGKNLMGPTISPVIIDYVISVQNNLFGDYPTRADIAPSAIFTACFFILGMVHLFIFCFNWSRGHYFYISFIWFLYCLLKVIGFITRLVWSLDITQINIGLASEVFLVIPTIILVAVNLVLAQRLFTWRHPVGGSRRLFWNFMITLYFVVIAVIVITVLASFVPYIDYISAASHKKWNKVVMASAILILLYSLTAIALLFLSYFFKPTRKDDNLYTYQPWWIKSFHPLYFVEKNAAQKAEETFMKRNHNHRHAIRVIAATHHHYNMVEGLTNERGTLEHNKSLALVCITTVFIFVGHLCRAVVVFQQRQRRYQNSLSTAVVMYIVWGAFEVIINVLYIVGRVDLRFYRPDVLPAKVRAIITAEQSYYPSDDEYERSIADDDDDFSTASYPSDDVEKPEAAHHSSTKLPVSTPPYPTTPNYKAEKYDDYDDVASDFHF